MLIQWFGVRGKQWPTYTNMGVDDRNQFDMIRSMPGGLPAVARLVKEFHSAGVKVLWPYHPWDISTRRELCGDSGPQSVAALDCTPSAPLDDASAVSAILLATGADGVNGDTMSEFSHQFYVRTKNVTGRPIGLQPESGESIDALAWSTIMWAEGWDNTPPPSWNPMDGDVWPPVSAAKMISESYMVQLTDRWAQNKAPQAATAWFNGIGLNSWENVWGIWNGLTPRDAELYRRMGALLRFAGGHKQGRGQEDATSTRSLLRSADWTPFAPIIHASNGPAFASTFVSSIGTPHEVFISVVSFGSRPGGLFPPPNTSEYADAWFELDPMYGSDHGYRLFDCYLGLELSLPRSTNSTGSANGGGGDKLNVSFTLEASYDSLKGLNGMSGFTGLLLTKNQTVDASLLAFLDRMRRLTSGKPLASFPCYGYMCAGTVDLQPWPFFESCNTSVCAGLTQQLVAIPPTANFSIMPPPGGGRMVAVPGGTFSFATTGVEIEGLDQQGVDVRFPWESSPSKTHTAQTLAMPPLWVDAHPVTNELYEKFLNESSWLPADRERWLLHWRGGSGGQQPTMPQSLAKRPVSYVSLSDARAFCAHYQKRLPHSWEWQWASGQAMGDNRPYPWGHASPSVHTCPKAQRGGVPQLHDVNSAPGGCSPHGVCDAMCSVWQLTDEFHDQHSRAVLLKGGSTYVMDGSSWYFPQVETLAQHGKYFLYSDGWERSATIGFRCIADRSASDTQPISMESERKG
jgi:formylglycine-generating enzyme required for sulfatase activity